MGIKLVSSMLSFIVGCLIIFGFVYCFLKCFLKKKNNDSTKNRSNQNTNQRNIIHLNYPNSDSPFYVQNSEIINLPNRAEMASRTETEIGTRPVIVPNAPPQSVDDQAPPPYSSVVKSNS